MQKEKQFACVCVRDRETRWRETERERGGVMDKLRVASGEWRADGSFYPS